MKDLFICKTSFEQFAFHEARFREDEFRVRKKHWSRSAVKSLQLQALILHKSAETDFHDADGIVKSPRFRVPLKMFEQSLNRPRFQIKEERLQMMTELFILRERYGIRVTRLGTGENGMEAVLIIDDGIVIQDEPAPGTLAELGDLPQITPPHSEVIAAVHREEQFNVMRVKERVRIRIQVALICKINDRKARLRKAGEGIADITGKRF